MDKYVDSRFERVERALASLIDSITKYNPSTSQAHDLAMANKELSAGLAQLQTHQSNHARIQELRRQTEDLDAQIKSTVSLLWSTRKEITATPTTSYPSSGPRYDFTYSDLLNYARRISRTTLPPPGVTNGVDPSAPPEQQAALEQAQATNGTGTGAEGSNAIASQASTTDSQFQQQQPGVTSAPNTDADNPNPNSTALPAHMLPAINLLEGALFYPWPAEDRIRSGALAVCQQLTEAGISPKGYDPEEEERLRAERAEEERRQAEKEEEERRAMEKRRAEAMERERAAARERERQRQESGAGDSVEPWRRGSMAADGQRSAGGEKKQFQFMGGLDDDEDEE